MEILHSKVVLPPLLRAGDPVRVTKVYWMPRYEPGDKGMVVMGPNGVGEELLYYLVMMHKDDPPCFVIFAANEIEPDY